MAPDAAPTCFCAGLGDELAECLNESVAVSTRRSYKTAFNAYSRIHNLFFDIRPHLNRGLLHLFSAIWYLIFIWMRGLGPDTCNMFISSFNHARSFCNLSSISTNATVIKIKKAFRKRKTKFNIALPTLSNISTKLKQFNSLCSFYIFCFVLSSLLAFRSGEIFLLEKSFIDFRNNVITWPDYYMQNGIKAGKKRNIPSYSINLLNIFCSFSRNPFANRDRNRVNNFLSKEFACTMQACRHIGANISLQYTNSMWFTSLVLGHDNSISTRFYIDNWHPNMDPEVLS